MNSKAPKVAIVHDWLIGGGAERVVEELHRLYPDAPIYTSYCSDEWRRRLDHKVVTGYLQHWPFSQIRKFIPVLRIWWFTQLSFNDYDLVISSSGAEAKGIKTGNETTHVNYCHAPTHYYWSRYDQYIQNPGFGVFDPLARLGLKLLVGPLRRWDLKAAQRPDYMIANSSHIQKQIKKYYRRDSTVIHPPIDTSRFNKLSTLSRNGFVIAGRQTPYKRIDLAVRTCTKLGLPLTVIGTGPEHKKLVSMAGPTITFITDASDKDVVRHFQTASAFIFPGLDDFGITPIEAMAAGTPVIAYKAGGALDYIVPNETGVFFDSQTVSSLEKALQQFTQSNFKESALRSKAEEFSNKTFEVKIASFISNLGLK